MPTSTEPLRPDRALDTLPAMWLNAKLMEIEKRTKKDVLAIYGNILPGVDMFVRMAIETLSTRKKELLVILHTNGGVVEEVQNIVNILRHHYKYVHFLVPVQAMSAGTVLALSGDKIYMDYFSRLGPIDPQLFEGSRSVPALSYLRQYEKLIEKSQQGELSSAEFVLLNKLDLAQLHQFDLAAQLSVSLIEDWLVKYKFKNWKESITKKKNRAKEIAEKFNDHQKWFSHGFNIHKDILEKDIRLKIDDYSDIKDVVWAYFWPLSGHINRERHTSFVHSRSLR